MAIDLLGNVNVVIPDPFGVFPLTPDYPVAKHIEPMIIVHRFKSANAKIEQRFKLGRGTVVWNLAFQQLTQTDLEALRTFWRDHEGSYAPFTFAEPWEDGTVNYRQAVFADQPISFEQLRDWITAGTLTLIEWPTNWPNYYVNQVNDRYPSGIVEDILTWQVQELVPVIVIQPVDRTYPPLYISNQKCNVIRNSVPVLYHARLITHSGIGQTVGGSSDFVRFTFGNADRAMTQVANQVDLFMADVSFGLIHVQTQTLIEIWKGQIDNYRPASDTEFQIECVDGAYDLGQQYPMRRTAPLCGKKYNDAASGCPWSTVSGGLDLVHFPAALTSECDRGYETPNGCLAHQMKHYFGGMQIDPQTVRVKNNDTGWFGLGRAWMTSTSIVSDSAMGQPLPKIITDVPIPVPCLMIAGRDESDFYEAVGMVGEGPLAYGRGTYDNAGNRRMHTLDGQPNHGDPGPLGLREVMGTDPAGPSDYFSLDQVGDQTGGDWRKVFAGASTYLDNFAGGVGFLVIRRADEKGFQLTTLDEHAMVAIVADGLYGPSWIAPGIRVPVNLTNPVWLAVTVWLEARGLLQAPIADQERVLDLPSLITAAGICKEVVPKLIGSGTETQFTFRGIIRDIKSMKDWLQEILNNCLGEWLISNGKLKVVIRQDSAAEASFGDGNIVYGTLMLGPIRPSFNRMTVNFANSDYEFVADSLQIRDNTNIDFTRRTRDGYMNLAGAASKSQAGRIGSVRLREELGGINQEEWRRAREGTFKTTVLALGMELMRGLSIVNEDVPGGSGVFRCTGWTLNPDMSIDMAVRTTTDSMYDLVTGPKAVDVPPNEVPVEFYPYPLRSAWCPNHESYGEDDQYFMKDQLTFGLAYAYRDQADTGKQALVLVTGDFAVNDPLPTTVPPTIRSQSASNAGGQLNAARNFFAQVCARNAAGRFSPPSNIRRIHIEGGGITGQFTVGDIVWPGGNWVSAVLFVGTDERVMCAQVEVIDSSGNLPTSFTFPGPWKPATYNAPSPVHRNVRVKVKRVEHGGVIGTQVTAVDVAAGTITLGGLAGQSDDWMGRVLSIIARQDNGSVPPTNFAIEEHDPPTGVMKLYPPPVDGEVSVGDLVYIRCLITDFSPFTIGDARFINDVYPDGLVPDEEVGMLIRAITGGRPHQLRTILSHTQTVYTVDKPWDFQPDYFIVEAPGWDYQSDGSQIKVPLIDLAQTIECTVTNFVNQPILVGAFLVDRNENETDEQFAVIRDGYIFGEQGDAGGLSGTIAYA